jgi:hypothetical protein
MDNEWQETKKEFTINENGEYVVKNVTMERAKDKILGFEKKDFWDQIIKSVGIITIVIPLILFKCSRDADIDKQKNIMQIDLFSNVLSDVQRIILLSDTSAEFKLSKKKLDIEYYSKMLMLGNDSIVNIYTSLKDTINLYALLADADHLLDTIKKHTRVINDVCKRSDKEFKILSANPTRFRDSTMLARAVLLEKTSVQWKYRKEFINSFNNENSSLKDTLSSILTDLNLHVPSIKSETARDTIKPSNLHSIDSLSDELYRKIARDVRDMAEFEKKSKESIKTSYNAINRQIRKFNNYLAK